MRLAPFALLFLLAAGPALAAPATVRIGALEVPADCPLARNEHPRLLFSKAELPRLRARIQAGLMADEFRFVEKWLDDGLARGSDRARGAITTLGLFYQLTGDRKYGLACKEWVLAHGEFAHYPTLGLYGYDMAYDLFTPEERRQCEQKALAFVKQQYSESARFVMALGIYGCGLEDDTVARQLSALQPWLKARKAYLNDWAADRGGDGNSHAYIGQHEYVGTCGAVQAWKTCTGEDWWEGFHWARDMAAYYVYHYVPARFPEWPADGGPATVHIGINCWGGNAYPEETGAENLCPIAAARWQDGLAQWWVRHVINGRKYDYQVLNQFWGELLWLDPDVPEIPPAAFPPTRLFRTRGYAALRSDWSENATFAHFHCGRFESDGRNNADNNSFILYRRGYLACDTGTRAVNNPEQTQYSDGRHHNRYFIQTVAHNSITVGTENVAGNGWTAVCGGQVSRPKREWLQGWGLPATEKTLYNPDAGRILAYETHPLFDYVAGDATRSYSPELVSGFTRQFVSLWGDRTKPEDAAKAPAFFVIFDRVSSVKPELPKRWYLHTMEEPKSDGRETPDGPGHFLCEGRTLTATHNGARILCRSLLPADAVIRKIGGPGHQFEVNGENYDMYPLWWEKIGTPGLVERLGLGSWRVEVEPRERRQEDLFLHVIQVDDEGMPLARIEPVERDGLTGARITLGERSCEVLFNTRGPVGGHLSLTEGGKPAVDAPLAEEIRDNYHNWRTDPRYPKWTGDKYYRAVIGNE